MENKNFSEFNTSGFPGDIQLLAQIYEHVEAQLEIECKYNYSHFKNLKKATVWETKV
jgi:hypothetical protein